ncbi:MAG: glycosyltransferase family 2 protein [Planctomycetota bacterium]|jgi:glycosyltransferase involved in cell wall biosynthesis
MAARVGIGLPVYNGTKYLRKTLDSILAQTYQDLELVISDNASTDSTENICRSYAAKDKRITYHRRAKNIGSAGNFNSAFGLSRSEYFKWIAADDEIAPLFLERCVEALDSDPEAVLAHPRAVIIDEFKNELHCGTFRYGLADLSLKKPADRLRHMFLHASVYPIFGLIRSSVLRKTPLLRSCVGADYCLLVDLLLLGKFAEIPEYLMRLRAHAGGHSCKVTEALRKGTRDYEKEAQWWNPNCRRNVVLPYWRRMGEHLLSVLRSGTSLREKIAMVALLCRVGNWWRRELGKEALHALGA